MVNPSQYVVLRTYGTGISLGREVLSTVRMKLAAIVEELSAEDTKFARQHVEVVDYLVFHRLSELRVCDGFEIR